MARDEKLDLLRRVPLFEGLKRSEIERIAALGDEVDLPAGRTFVREGDRGHEFFVILDGRVRIKRQGKSLETLRRGDFLGEIALVSRIPRTATVMTTSPVRVLVITDRAFRTLLEHSPQIQMKVLEALAERAASDSL